MLYDDSNVDWVPSLKMGYTATPGHEDALSLEARNFVKRELEVAEAMLLLSAMYRVMPFTAAGKTHP